MTKGQVGKALVIGEVLYDCFEGTDVCVLGGAPANVAARIQELGAEVAFVSRVGNDDWGRNARKELLAAGLSVDNLQQDPAAKTGTVLVQGVTGSADVIYTIMQPVAYDYLEYSPEVAAAARTCDLLYFGTLIQRGTHNQEFFKRLLATCRTDVPVFVDVNLRRDCYTREIIERSLAHATIVKLNNDELSEIFHQDGWRAGSIQDQARDIMKQWPNIEKLFVTLGARGAILFTKDGREYYQPGFAADPGGDTIGAGDAFSASIIRDMLRREFSPERSLEQACRVATLVASQRGGFGLLPNDWRTKPLEIFAPSLERVPGRDARIQLPA